MFQRPGSHYCGHSTAKSKKQRKKSTAGQPQPAHDIIHDKCDPGHISTVFQNSKGEEKDKYIGKKCQDPAYARNNSVYNKRLQHGIDMKRFKAAGGHGGDLIKPNLEKTF